MRRLSLNFFFFVASFSYQWTHRRESRTNPHDARMEVPGGHSLESFLAGVAFKQPCLRTRVCGFEVSMLLSIRRRELWHLKDVSGSDSVRIQVCGLPFSQTATCSSPYEVLLRPLYVTSLALLICTLNGVTWNEHALSACVRRYCRRTLKSANLKFENGRRWGRRRGCEACKFSNGWIITQVFRFFFIFWGGGGGEGRGVLFRL